MMVRKWRVTAFVALEVADLGSKEAVQEAAHRKLGTDALIEDYVIETVEPIWKSEGEK